MCHKSYVCKELSVILGVTGIHFFTLDTELFSFKSQFEANREIGISTHNFSST